MTYRAILKNLTISTYELDGTRVAVSNNNPNIKATFVNNQDSTSVDIFTVASGGSRVARLSQNDTYYHNTSGALYASNTTSSVDRTSLRIINIIDD